MKALSSNVLQVEKLLSIDSGQRCGFCLAKLHSEALLFENKRYHHDCCLALMRIKRVAEFVIKTETGEQACQTDFSELKRPSFKTDRF